MSVAQWQPLQSSNVAATRYDPTTETLEVRFHSGRSYAYERVPSSIYQGLVDAESPGKYFNTSIKDNYSVA